jgi:hypothetical protein
MSAFCIKINFFLLKRQRDDNDISVNLKNVDDVNFEEEKV